MGSTPSRTDPPEAEATQPVINMAEFGARIAERKAALGLPDLPRNSGNRRTTSKRALLKAIEEAGGGVVRVGFWKFSKLSP